MISGFACAQATLKVIWFFYQSQAYIAATIKQLLEIFYWLLRPPLYAFVLIQLYMRLQQLYDPFNLLLLFQPLLPIFRLLPLPIALFWPSLLLLLPNDRLLVCLVFLFQFSQPLLLTNVMLQVTLVSLFRPSLPLILLIVRLIEALVFLFRPSLAH